MINRTVVGAFVAIATMVGALAATTVSADARPPGPPWCWVWHHHHWRWVCGSYGYDYGPGYYQPGFGIYLGNGYGGYHHHHHHDHHHKPF
jgi:hypothetical protein